MSPSVLMALLLVFATQVTRLTLGTLLAGSTSQEFFSIKRLDHSAGNWGGPNLAQEYYQLTQPASLQLLLRKLATLQQNA